MKQRTGKVTYNQIHCKGHNNDRNQAVENVLTKHDRYLIELAKHKKNLKYINKKDHVEEEREKKEYGFSAYVNGANAIVKQKPKRPVKSSNNFRPKSTTSLPKPTIISPRKKSSPTRVKTAPEPERKFWGQGSVEIATSTGEKLYASVRGITRTYSDDFEDSTDFENFPEKNQDIDKNSLNENLQTSPVLSRPVRRKYWGQGPVSVKVTSGENLQLSINRINCAEYSMNFEECSDESISQSDEEIPEEIETFHRTTCTKDDMPPMPQVLGNPDNELNSSNGQSTNFVTKPTRHFIKKVHLK